MTRNKFDIFRAVGFIFIILNVVIIISDKGIQAQRSLHHWKQDLEHRLRLYQEQRNTIDSIVSTSIYSQTRQVLGPTRITSDGNVRLSDLIIPSGALRLSNHVANSAVRILVDKTQAYVNAKRNELDQIQSQLSELHRQLGDPTNQYIYKGHQYAPQPRRNTTGITISGTRVFKQMQFANMIESQNVTLKRINYTDVDRVIDDTYLKNTKFGVFDAQGRLFFEGRKTFWDTVFTKPLQSGCCDRLKPLHTNRMMLRSVTQDVQAPILIQSREANYGQVASILNLSTKQFYNKIIQLDPRPALRPGESGLLPTPPPENFIQLQNIISTRQLDQPQILKTIVFKSPVVIEEALLDNSYPDNRLVIGIANSPNFAFDLSHNNYLLRYFNAPRNFSIPEQVISGTLVVDGPTSFLKNVEALTVNRVTNFAQFVQDSIVSINRPSVIRGPIQFNALPVMMSRENLAGSPAMSRPPQSVQILHVFRNLEVGLLNGMQVPNDLVLLPSVTPMDPRLVQHNAPFTLQPGQLVRVRGQRHFANQASFEFLAVSGPVNGLRLPEEVIPLHLNDFMPSVGHSNLRFLDGVTMFHLIVQSNQFDEINLRDVNGDAQSIVTRSMSARQADGSLLVRAPLRVLNLNLINGGPNRGMLNGFRPQEVLATNRPNPFEILYGRKKFVAHVEATDCIFNDINQVTNWTNHLIRIDRPNTVQTVHTRLAFTSAPPIQPLPIVYNSSRPINANFSVGVVNVDRLNVEFYPDTNPVNYQNNWNFSPELYLLHQALTRNVANYTGGRYRVKHVRLINPGGGGLVNRISLGDIVTLDQPFRFADTFTMVGKVEVANTLQAGRIQSNYPIDAMDLVQFDRHRIPLMGATRAPIRLENLVLGPDNRASFVQCRMLNGISFNEFARSIMSLTRPQEIYSNLVFNLPVSFEGPVSTRSSLNGIKNFRQFAQSLKGAQYSFEEGLQCNAVVIRT